MFNKFMIITDCDFPLTDYNKLLHYLGENVNLPSDLHSSSGPLDILDHAARSMGFGGKLGIDATQKFPEEIQSQPTCQKEELLPDATYLLNNLPEIRQARIFEFSLLKFALLFSVEESVQSVDQLLNHLLSSSSINNVVVIILVESFAYFEDISYLLWYGLNNTDPGRDCSIVNAINDGHPIFYMDARRKIKDGAIFGREWPNAIVSAQRTISAVDDKWDKLKIGTFIPSPSLRFCKLVRNEGAIADRSRGSS